MRRRASAGFTLIELVFSVLVLGIIASLEVMLLQTGLESFRYGNAQVALHRAGDELMENLLEGGYEGEGIRDGLELKEASLTSIGLVMLWTDRSHKPNPVKNKDQKFVLDRQFKPGASTPLAQVQKPDSTDFVSVPIRFTYGSSQDPKSPDDVVQFLEPIPLLSRIKILYTPDGDRDPEVIKIFRWDPAAKRIYESYAGKTRDIIQHDPSVKVERCAFLYFDNLNRLIPMEGGSLSSLSVKRATAVKLYLVLREQGEYRELSSFTNVRNVSTIGATITEGAQLPMPTPGEIKAFSIGDFYGFKKEGIVELLVTTATQAKGWKIRLKFKPAQKEEDIILERFQMEAPPGKILASVILEQTVSRSEFVNIQTLDRSGLYDYDDDEEVKDQVSITGANPIVTVTRLDFEGASLFIRP